MSQQSLNPRPLIAGNWKMNGLQAAIGELNALESGLGSNPALMATTDIMICPPATLICAFAAAVGSNASKIEIGAQDCHWQASGAHTGDISPEMLRDAGATAVIIGHSERRSDHGELDRKVRAKAEAAYRAGLKAIICIGETAGERRANLTLEVVKRQLRAAVPDQASGKNTIIAYEPVWAIGTGLTPSPADVQAVHQEIRDALKERFGEPAANNMRIIYGGSVKPDNAKDLLLTSNVNGALVGGASLKAADLLGIISAYA